MKKRCFTLLVGPHQEKTELLFFPATEETGLHRVHPTWAGTFVLAALVSIFPGINFILSPTPFSRNVGKSRFRIYETLAEALGIYQRWPKALRVSVPNLQHRFPPALESHGCESQS